MILSLINKIDKINVFLLILLLYIEVKKKLKRKSS